MNMMILSESGILLSPNEIRKALICLAEDNCRPHYPVIVQREVIDAFRTGAYHPLKEGVIQTNAVITKSLNANKSHLTKLREFASAYAIRMTLARAADVDPILLVNILVQNSELTEEIWQKLNVAMADIKANPELYKETNKQDQCGTYARYKIKGCRCKLCCKALDVYDTMRKISTSV